MCTNKFCNLRELIFNVFFFWLVITFYIIQGLATDLIKPPTRTWKLLIISPQLHVTMGPFLDDLEKFIEGRSKF